MLSMKDIFLLFPHQALPPRAPEALVYEYRLWKSSQQQEPLQKAIPIHSDSSAVAAFI